MRVPQDHKQKIQHDKDSLNHPLLLFAWIQVLISAYVWNPREKCELLAKSWGNSRGMESEKRPNTGRKARIWPAEKFWFKSPTSVYCLVQKSWNPPPPHHHHVTHTDLLYAAAHLAIKLFFLLSSLLHLFYLFIYHYFASLPCCSFFCADQIPVCSIGFEN